MKIHYCENYAAMSQMAAEIVLQGIQTRPDLLLCAATGGSPEGLYQRMHQNADRFAALRLIKLDEWGGLPAGSPATGEHYLRQRLVEPLGITPERYISFASDPDVPQAECDRVQNALSEQGPIDICVLGLGTNGHLALNEPADELQPHCHVAALKPSSLTHSMLQGSDVQPGYGLTLGIGNLLQSRKIIMLVSGQQKEEAFRAMLSQRISTQLPASFLWLHPNVECIVDQSIIS